MNRLDDYQYAHEILELAMELLQQYVEERVLNPDASADSISCSLQDPCTECLYDEAIDLLEELEFELQ